MALPCRGSRTCGLLVSLAKQATFILTKLAL